MATDACSSRSLAAGEPLAGTAVTDARWLVLEQPGPWTPKVAGALADRCAELGIRLQLVRRTVARPAAAAPRACFLAALGADRRWWVQQRLVRAPEEVLDLPLEALAAGVATGAADPLDHPLHLVCAHGERDPCCARLGRPLHRALSAVRPQGTWQTSHLGGHRFAATMVHFPSGHCLGRVPAARAREVAELLESGRIPLELLRGRVGDPWAVQAAEALVRLERGLDRFDDVEAIAWEGDEVRLRLPGGETLDVRVGREPLAEERPASCGKPAEPAARPVLRAAAWI